MSAGGGESAALGGGGIIKKKIVVQPDGKLVAEGYSYSDNDIEYEFALVRYNTNGTLDSTFWTGGMVTTAIGDNDDGAYALVIQPDGKLVAGGYANDGSQKDFALARYLGGLTITI